MRNKILLLMFSVFMAISLNGQNLKIGVSLNAITDFDWDKPMSAFSMTEKHMSLKSVMPLKLGVCVHRNFKVVSPSLHVNFIYRNLEYTENHTPITNFNHYSLNIPLNLNFRKQVSDESSFIANIGGGINFVLSSSDETKFGVISNDTLVYSFQILKPNKPIAFVNCGIGWELSFENIGAFQIKVEYLHEFSKQIEYKYINRLNTTVSNAYRINYLSYGLTYLLPINKR